jgi:hypothetical protein
MPVKFLQRFYFVLLIILLLIVILTPKLIHGGWPLVDEEITEVTMIAISLFLSWVIYKAHRKEVEKNKDKLDSLVSHIGKVNLQVETIKTLFEDIEKYPESKNDLKNLFKSLGQKVLGIVNVGWVLFRIIETDSLKSLVEHCETREKFVVLKYQVGNKELAAGQSIDGMTVLSSTQKNLKVKAFCILPTRSVAEHQRVLISPIINSLEMLYIIFASKYYRYYKNNSAEH